MECQYKLKGAFITPTGEFYYTDNNASHGKIIRQLKPEKYLRDNVKNLQWTEDEKNFGRDNDLTYIAMKLGFVRVISFRDQFGLEYIVKVTDNQLNIINQLYKEFANQLWNESGEKITNFTAENISNNILIQSSSFEDFINNVKSQKQVIFKLG